MDVVKFKIKQGVVKLQASRTRGRAGHGGSKTLACVATRPWVRRRGQLNAYASLYTAHRSALQEYCVYCMLRECTVCVLSSVILGPMSTFQLLSYCTQSMYSVRVGTGLSEAQ